jgi:hypothetical protein
MISAEQAPNLGIETFGMDGDFDINSAFQDAMFGVISDAELMLEEKVRRVEVMVTEGTSDTYRDFVDLRSLAAQIEMFCNHDHGFNQALQGNETISGFRESHKPEDGHNHQDTLEKHKDKDDEIDPKTGKKRKKGSISLASLFKV